VGKSVKGKGRGKAEKGRLRDPYGMTEGEYGKGGLGKGEGNKKDPSPVARKPAERGGNPE